MSRKQWFVILIAALVPACSGNDIIGPLGSGGPGGTAPLWVWQNPLPHANYHRSIQALGVGRVAALSYYDLIETRDGGASWQPLGPHGHFYDAYVRPGVAAVLGDGTAFVSADGSNSWRETAPIFASAIAFWDPQHGVAVGSGGSIATTDDGGTTWNARFSGTDRALLDVEYLDSLIVFAGGRRGTDPTLLRSINGGVTWSAISNSGIAGSVLAVDITSQVVRIVDGDGFFYVSSNRGATWTKMSLGIEVADIDFLDGVRGIAVGHGGSILATYDGGIGWVDVSLGADVNLFAACYAADDDMWAGGIDGHIYRSLDGGLSWSSLQSGPHADLSAVSFADADVGFVVGPRHASGSFFFPTAMKTVDGGRSWNAISVGSGFDTAGDLNAVSMADQDHAVAVGEAGQVWATANGGASWTSLDAGTSEDLYDVEFTDGNHGIIVGRAGLARVTIDGGANWSDVAGVSTGKNLRAVSFASPDVAMIVGVSGTAWRSTDGGQSFAEAAGGIGALDHLGDVVMLDEVTAIAATVPGTTAGSTILRTNDGGASWNGQQVPGLAVSTVSLAFETSSRGYAIIDKRYAYVTDDGGLTWESFDLPTSAYISGISSVGNRGVTIVGERGAILHSTTGGR